MSETQTTTETDAATTTEGATTSNPAATETATAAVESGQQQQATEGQTAEAATAEAIKPEGAPEKYEFKAPEGKEYSPSVLDGFTEAARALNLPQEAAQAMLDKIAPALAAKHEESLAAARAQWESDAKADKEFGGDKLPENLAVAQKAIEQFGTPELRALLNDSGLGNHPEFVRVFWKVGKAISEDGFVAGRGGKETPSSVAQRMYPEMNP